MNQTRWNWAARRGGCFCLALVALACFDKLAAQEANRPYRLPAVDLQQRVLWGSICEPEAGQGLSFGGEDQRAEDGCARTRLLREGEWIELRPELEKGNPWQEGVKALRDWDLGCGRLAAETRNRYFTDEARLQDTQEATERPRELFKHLSRIAERLRAISALLPPTSYHCQQGLEASKYWEAALDHFKTIDDLPMGPDQFAAMAVCRQLAQQAAEALDCEPAPRALSPLCYDPVRKVYLLFGGDHLDYLTCDLWSFDPAVPQWRKLRPEQSPPPRANHQLSMDRQGRLALTGGYTYTSSTDYMGGQYRDWNDGTWTYDFTTNEWTGTGKLVAARTRVYRAGPFNPAFFWQGERPNQQAFQEKLAKLPANEWVKLDTPFLPEMNRDWGTATLDPTRDLILRFSGGHSAHGGTDVPQFHLATGRWQLPFAVEFPLGQLYSNTSYPEGFNFNRRPWVTGHTYKSYAYDEASRRMLFVGEWNYTYLYDPERGDWTGQRVEKPEGMNYGDCFYTLTLCPTAQGTFCWTNAGRLFRWERVAEDELGWHWLECKLTGAKMPGSVVDRAGLAYDGRRGRLLFTTKPYEGPFDGQVYAVDARSWEVTRLDPPNRAALRDVGFLREVVYVPELDMLIQGVVFPPQDGQPRLTPAFDCRANRWLAVEFAGNDPHGREGRNVSLGLMVDARRKLVWAVDTQSQVYVLRPDANSLRNIELKSP